MVNKRDLGVGYLIGTGLGLIFGLAGHALVSVNSPIVTIIETSIAVLSSLLLLYIGYWLRQSALSDKHVWSVARWGTIGLGLPMIASLVITVFELSPMFLHLSPSMYVNTIAVGGIIGVLVGAVVLINREHRTIQQLNQRNVVLNRVLRHNIRNDMNVILGYAENLKQELGPSHAATVEAIRKKATEVVNLSTSARKIGAIDGTARGEPVDVVDIIQDRLDMIQLSYPPVTVKTDLPEEAWVLADPLLRSIIDHVVENAIVHNDQQPVITVSVTKHADDVEIEVADNGPGIPSEEFEVLTNETETPLQHGEGLGLWLVKWFLESFDGDIQFNENEPRGSIVCIRLPRVPAPQSPAPDPAPAV